jgi:3-oxoacyl-[acyl-carrier protein] reductase
MSNFIIIGGTKGIGLELAKSLAKEHQVYVFARNRNDLPEHDNIHFKSYDALGDDLTELPEVINGLAYCPGSINLMPFHRIKPEQFLTELQINLMGAIKGIQAALPGLKAANGASVVTFSTVAVQTGMPFHASIAAAKGAVEGLTRSLAAEYAANLIRFNCIAPSLTATSSGRETTCQMMIRKLAAAKRHPIGRYGETIDIASMAEFLLTEKSRWITGQILHVDGGMSSLRMF